MRPPWQIERQRLDNNDAFNIRHRHASTDQCLEYKWIKVNTCHNRAGAALLHSAQPSMRSTHSDALRMRRREVGVCPDASPSHLSAWEMSVMHLNQVHMRCSSSHVHLCSYEFCSTPPMFHSFHGEGKLLLTNRLQVKHPKELDYLCFVISYNAINKVWFVIARPFGEVVYVITHLHVSDYAFSDNNII